MNILALNSEAELTTLLDSKPKHHFFVFKHSEVCPVSVSAREEIVTYAKTKKIIPVYQVEVRNQRPLSNLLSEKLELTHESPQLILIKNGKTPVWHTSHFFITEESIENALREHDCLPDAPAEN